MANNKCIRKIRTRALKKAMLITYPPRKYCRFEREIETMMRTLQSALEQDPPEVEIVIG